ncbi:MAG: hypothetical protein ACK4XK_12900, partial [Casimicrobiaceae bacterium]
MIPHGIFVPINGFADLRQMLGELRPMFQLDLVCFRASDVLKGGDKDLPACGSEGPGAGLSRQALLLGH